MKLFESLMQPTNHSTVLDVGGTPFNWYLTQNKPRVTLLNLHVEAIGQEPPGAVVVIADGRMLPFKDNTFDIIFCNSLIEHLNSDAEQGMLAREISRVGRNYFVQTPNRYFPLEPHFLAPGFQFLPVAARRLLARNFTPWGWITRPSSSEARTLVDEIRLLSGREMCGLFPDGQIVYEKLVGLKKSIIAFRR